MNKDGVMIIINGYEIKSGTDLRSADLRNANLGGISLSNVYLRNANLTGADLSDVQFCDVDLSSANFTGANGVLVFQFNKHTLVSYKEGDSIRVSIDGENDTLEYWLENYRGICLEKEYQENDIKNYYFIISSLETMWANC